MGLDSRTAVITGGSGGIGLAIAEAYQRRGAKVVVFGRNADALRTAEEQLGETALAVRATLLTVLISNVSSRRPVSASARSTCAWRMRVASTSRH